jgi:hypothetical protein
MGEIKVVGVGLGGGTTPIGSTTTTVGETVSCALTGVGVAMGGVGVTVKVGVSGIGMTERGSTPGGMTMTPGVPS